MGWRESPKIFGGMMRQRIVQLISRYVAVAVAAVGGFVSGDQLDATAQATTQDAAMQIASGAAVVVLLFGDLLIHRVTSGGFMKTGGGE